MWHPYIQGVARCCTCAIEAGNGAHGACFTQRVVRQIGVGDSSWNVCIGQIREVVSDQMLSFHDGQNDSYWCQEYVVSRPIQIFECLLQELRNSGLSQLQSYMLAICPRTGKSPSVGLYLAEGEFRSRFYRFGLSEWENILRF